DDGCGRRFRRRNAQVGAGVRLRRAAAGGRCLRAARRRACAHHRRRHSQSVQARAAPAGRQDAASGTTMSALRLSVINGRVSVRGEATYRQANTQSHGEWYWDGEHLRARVCRLGVHPLFWRATRHGVALATTPLDLLEEGADLDYPALAVFLRLGFFVGEDTPFAGVRQLAPGAQLQWDAARGLRVEDGEFAVGGRVSLSRDDA